MTLPGVQSTSNGAAPAHQPLNAYGRHSPQMQVILGSPVVEGWPLLVRYGIERAPLAHDCLFLDSSFLGTGASRVFGRGAFQCSGRLVLLGAPQLHTLTGGLCRIVQAHGGPQGALLQACCSIGLWPRPLALRS
ncbi:hypothetical protein NDU88_005980 [Pleurodeles waltl]|uniref:Uncharacterized protein n=1 Tax=Pleurodeles waltl TaxID=8319 RepID=A0AAV7NT28_PLEWA|nr:hypothetical protein NDU88_005980 [Pleurodeles waltl]